MKKSTTGKQVERLALTIFAPNVSVKRHCARLLRQAKAEYASCNDLTRRSGSLLVVDIRPLHK